MIAIISVQLVKLAIFTQATASVVKVTWGAVVIAVRQAILVIRIANAATVTGMVPRLLMEMEPFNAMT